MANFKSLEYATLPLSRLTILTGANSSGKSSLIQSLLLLAQSPDDEIILNGPLVRLGEPLDVIRSGCDTLTVSFTIAASHAEERRDEEWAFEVALAANQSTLEITEFNAAVDGNHILSATSQRVTAATKMDLNPDQRFGDTILRVREMLGRAAPPRTHLSFRGFYPEALILRRKKDRVLAALRREYSKKALVNDPERAFQLYEQLQPWWRAHESELPESVVELYGNLFRRASSPAQLADTAGSGDLDRLFTLYAEAAESEKWLAVPASRLWSPQFRAGLYSRPLLGVEDDFRAVMRGLAIADDGLNALRESVRYLGPLREEPQVVSASGGRNRSLPAGTKGEYTADLLAREKNSHVTFYDWSRRRHTQKLPDAVSLWTTYLGVGDSVTVEDQGKLGRGLRLRVNGVDRDLTTVGVGASQLLPVISVVLAAEPGSIVCIEQPELHLHPGVQSRLADFFLFARPDVLLVVETHSEYMITRVRRRAAENAVDESKVAIFFAEQEAAVTRLRRLILDALGDLSAWPSGFFDTQEVESRALVQAVARAARRVRNDIAP